MHRHRSVTDLFQSLLLLSILFVPFRDRLLLPHNYCPQLIYFHVVTRVKLGFVDLKNQILLVVFPEFVEAKQNDKRHSFQRTYVPVRPGQTTNLQLGSIRQVTYVYTYIYASMLTVLMVTAIGWVFVRVHHFHVCITWAGTGVTNIITWEMTGEGSVVH